MKKTVLITGASRGIGRETAILFALKGYNVVANYCSSKDSALNLHQTLKNIEAEHLIYKADVSNIDNVENMVEESIKRFGKIDVLINNAGISEQKLFSDITKDDFQKMFDVNMGGVFNCCKFIVPEMVKRKSGKIINISSIWGECGASCEVHYSASKAAVIGFTKALAKELGPSSIQVNCVSPGVIDTNMNRELTDQDIKEIEQKTPLGSLGTVQDIANTLLFLASDNASFITGQVIGVNGGIVI